MSQEQPQRTLEGIKYGDLLDVSGELANQPIAPQDAALMQSIITESVAGQVVGKYTEDVPMEKTPTADIRVDDKITIGEALEVSALTAGEKPVDQSDAAAIQAAEVRATHSNVIIPGGVAAMAQSAANVNARMCHSNEDKTKLADILTDASTKLPGDKPVTRQDAEGVMVAELRNNLNLATHPGGVGASVVAAARINQRNK
ncbi:Late embryogenesis abundant protein [Thalictrum thalictroides]|uniref:Late embryogenesis abundant protein n=1 Tax=Thalictrum thalictroides TaxID=46969 RepID=A0A7J6W6L0_THATH|nr:Late embryogenesis abundant protein [Thalictrum thalictroides]